MFRIGADAAHVDVRTKIDGTADFERAYRARSRGEFFGAPVGYLPLEDMLRTISAATVSGQRVFASMCFAVSV